MLETKFKVVFLLAVLAFAAIPIMGILRGTTLTPFEKTPADSTDSTSSGLLDPSQVSHEAPVQEEMVSIPAGPFIRGTDQGGFDEHPQRTLLLDAFAICRYGRKRYECRRCHGWGRKCDGVGGRLLCGTLFGGGSRTESAEP